ncbi:unnamed protein product [Symbiodinium sp. CCMP2592]|nr:unnamed protein product [Symbiodinium sp. CCMP2592]
MPAACKASQCNTMSVPPVACTSALPVQPVTCPASSTRPAATPVRPSDTPFSLVRLGMAARIEVLPAHLDRPELRNRPVMTFNWATQHRAAGATAELRQQDRYALFDTASHLSVRRLPEGWCINDIVADIIGSQPQVRSVRFHMDRLPHLPAIQVTATLRGAEQRAFTVPLDLRTVEGRICTIDAPIGCRPALLKAICVNSCATGRLPRGLFHLVAPDGSLAAIPADQAPPFDFVRSTRDDPAPVGEEQEQEPVVSDEDDEATLMQLHAGVHSPHITSAMSTDDGWNGTRGTTCKVSVDHPVLEPVHPPSLLAKAGPPRASIWFDKTPTYKILPERWATPALLRIPAGQLNLYCAVEENHDTERRYALFDRLRHTSVRKAAADWTLEDYAADAVMPAPEPTAIFQIVTIAIAGLPTPQFTLTPAGVPAASLTLPVDARNMGGPVLALLLRPGMPSSEVFDRIASVFPAARYLVDLAAPLDGLFLQDALGRVWESWMTVRIDRTAFPGAPQFAPTSAQSQWAGTTSTTTAMQQALSSGTHISFVLAGEGTLIRLAPQPVQQVNVQHSIAEMLLILARQGRMPRHPMISICTSMPRNPERPNDLLVGFVLYSSATEATHVAILQDFSADGTMLQAITVDVGTRLEHMIGSAQSRRGFIPVLNGVPRAAANRNLVTGDLVQVQLPPLTARVVTVAHLYFLLPELRLFAMPLSMPSMAPVVRNPLDPGFIERGRDAARRTLHLRSLERRVMRQPAAHGAVIWDNGQRRPSSSASIGTGGTSLVQIPDVAQKQAARCKQLRDIHEDRSHCPCVDGALQCPPPLPLDGAITATSHFYDAAHASHSEAPSGVTATLGEAPPRGHQLDVQQRDCIPTPLGRRAVRRAPSQTSTIPHAKPGDSSSGGLVQTPTIADAHEHRSVRQVVSLASCIPDSDRKAYLESSLHLGLPEDAIDVALASFDLCHVCHDKPQGLSLPQVTSRFLHRLPQANHHAVPTALLMYVDGSYEAESGAWAVCCLGLVGDEWQWLGYFADVVPAQVEIRSAFEPELYAQLVALGIAARLGVPTTVFYDCTSAAVVATGGAATSAATPLARAAANLYMYSGVRGHWPAMQHVRSHQGDPLNELVDRMAKGALRSPELRAPLGDMHIADYVCHQAFEWLWLYHVRKHSTAWPTVDAVEAKMQVQGVLRFSGPILQGQLGCQIWIDPRSGPWVASAFRVTFRHPRMLEVQARLGDQPLTIISGHCPTAASPEVERQEWWRMLRSRLLALPPGHVPLLLLDANARFLWQEGSEAPSNDNGRELDQLADEFGLRRTAAHEPDGTPRISWQPPAGSYASGACLDYVVCRDDWFNQRSEQALLPIEDVQAGIDHTPIMASFSADLWRPFRDPARLNRDAMRTEQGREQIRHIFDTIPTVPWHVCVDEHLQIINKHLQSGLLDAFAGGPRPRKPTTSETTWQLLQARRMQRRTYRRQALLRSKWVLSQCFRAWSGGNAMSARAMHRRKKRHHMQAAHHIATMQSLSRQLREAHRRDEAEFTRLTYQDCREQGPVVLARKLRTVMRCGRGGAKAGIPDALRCQGQVLTEPGAILDAFGHHFAKTEAATPRKLDELCEKVDTTDCSSSLQLNGAPSLADLAAAFASLKSGKSPGISGIPSEVYSRCAPQAALCHMPLVLKALSRKRMPTLWTGMRAHPIPKPKKPSDVCEGYRSIALAEPASKAIGKSTRAALSRCFEACTLPTIGGARAGFPAEIPAMAARSHIATLRRTGRAGATIYVDGEAAFYAALRSHLFTADAHELQAYLGSLQLEDEVRRRICQAIGSQGALERAGLCEASVALLKGSPVADIVFQFVIGASLQCLAQHLADEGIAATVDFQQQSVTATPQSWVDDITVLLTSASAESVYADTARASVLICQYLSVAGIRVNFSPGKTEAMVSLHGPGTVRARNRIMLEGGGTISFDLPGQKSASIRCVAE